MPPELTVHPLTRADGSATYKSTLFTILAGVNGPIEVSRRDELPEEAALEINIRPSAGIGGPRERWLEGLLTRLFRGVMLVHLLPRMLVQITLQVVRDGGDGDGRGGTMGRRERDVAVIPDLVNAAFLALVDSGVPLNGVVLGMLGVVDAKGEVVVRPEGKSMVGCRSLHAFVFDKGGDVLLNESVGPCTLEVWREVCARLRRSALEALEKGNGDGDMANGHSESETPWLRKALEERVRSAGAWREDG